MQGKSFINQMTSDIYTYDFANKLFIISGQIALDTADLQRFLRNQSQRWLKITAPVWTYQTPTNPLMLYIE